MYMLLRVNRLKLTLQIRAKSSGNFYNYVTYLGFMAILCVRSGLVLVRNLLAEVQIIIVMLT